MRTKRSPLYVTLIIILLILIGICSFFIYYFFDMSHNVFDLENILYTEESEINYQVSLKDNEYYNSSENNDIYLTDLIDNIDSYFNYTLTFNSKVKGEYNYYVIGNLNVYVEDTDEKILTRELYRSEEFNYQIDGNVLALTEDFDMNIDEYLALYNQFKADYDMEFKADITFDVNISYDVYSDIIGKKISDYKTLSVSLPVDDTTTSITVSPKVENEKREFSELTESDNRLYIAIYLEFGGAILLFIVLIIWLVKKIVDSESLYSRVLKSILRSYDSIIVEINDLPNLTNVDILFVPDFKELVDAQKELKRPINYNEVIKEHEAIFILTDNDKAYVYKLRDIDLINKK